VVTAICCLFIVNNETDNNQHYITESFVKKRFGQNGFVQRYDIKHNSWKENASPQFVFSGRGYTQLLVKGEEVDNSLEKSFSDLENKLQFILPALDNAATCRSTTIQEELYKDFCFYCAYLFHLSPFAKAKAPADFVMQLDMDLRHHNLTLLRELQFTDNAIAMMLTKHSEGYKFIIKGENYLQLVFRLQFVKNCRYRAMHFRNYTKWTVYNSPVELPISDIALIDIPESKAAQLFILPICPHRVLIGRSECGSPPPFYTTDSILYGNTLPDDAAEHVLEIICLSAIKAIACKNQMDIRGIRQRAKDRKVSFTKISDLDAVLSAGMKTIDIEKDFSLVPVPNEEFVEYVHSFVRLAE
jgi:hypothetical protein